MPADVADWIFAILESTHLYYFLVADLLKSLDFGKRLESLTGPCAKLGNNRSVLLMWAPFSIVG